MPKLGAESLCATHSAASILNLGDFFPVYFQSQLLIQNPNWLQTHFPRQSSMGYASSNIIHRIAPIANNSGKGLDYDITSASRTLRGNTRGTHSKAWLYVIERPNRHESVINVISHLSLGRKEAISRTEQWTHPIGTFAFLVLRTGKTAFYPCSFGRPPGLSPRNFEPFSEEDNSDNNDYYQKRVIRSGSLCFFLWIV